MDEGAISAGEATHLPTLSPALAEVEHQRRRLITRWRWGVLGALVLTLGVIALTQAGILPALVGSFAIPLGIALVLPGLRPLFAVRERIRGEVYRAAADASGLAYAPGAPHSDDRAHDMDLSRLVYWGLCPRHQRIEVEDSWHGVRNGRDFALCHMRLFETSPHRGRGGRVADLQYVEIRFLRRFEGTSLFLTGAFRDLASPDLPGPVALIDVDRAHPASLRSNRELEARFFFDQKLRQCLLALEEALAGINLRAVLEGERFLILLDGKRLFEPGSIFSAIEGEAQARAVIARLRALLDMLDALADPPRPAPPL